MERKKETNALLHACVSDSACNNTGAERLGLLMLGGCACRGTKPLQLHVLFTAGVKFNIFPAVSEPAIPGPWRKSFSLLSATACEVSKTSNCCYLSAALPSLKIKLPKAMHHCCSRCGAQALVNTLDGKAVSLTNRDERNTPF